MRELRQNASRSLDRVKSGETVEITERGRLVARLVPPEPASARGRLIAEGKLAPAPRPFRIPARVARRAGEPDSAQVLDDLRDDRL